MNESQTFTNENTFVTKHLIRINKRGIIENILDPLKAAVPDTQNLLSANQCISGMGNTEPDQSFETGPVLWDRTGFEMWTGPDRTGFFKNRITN